MTALSGMLLHSPSFAAVVADGVPLDGPSFVALWATACVNDLITRLALKQVGLDYFVKSSLLCALCDLVMAMIYGDRFGGGDSLLLSCLFRFHDLFMKT